MVLTRLVGAAVDELIEVESVETACAGGGALHSASVPSIDGIGCY